MKANEVLKKIKELKENDARNRMGCSENWYNFFFAMRETFSEDEICNMSDREIELLNKLAQNIQDGLY